MRNIELSENFAFVMNVRDLLDTEGHVLAPGHILRRANANEISVIKETIDEGMANYLDTTLWEQSWSSPESEEAPETLDEKDWRYVVIGFKGSARTVHELELVFDIAPLEIEIGFIFFGHEADAEDPEPEEFNRTFVYAPGRMFHVLEAASDDVLSRGEKNSFFVRPSGSDIDELRKIRSQLKETDSHLLDVKVLAQQLGQMKELPHNSPLRFLGYFAILESLLTHIPKASDPYDSITRQVRKKLALLNNRWQHKIDYRAFGNASPDKIWTKMYDYRSRVAHGGTLEVTEELVLLQSHEAALTLVKNTAKAVVRHALSEPQLLLDLREC